MDRAADLVLEDLIHQAVLLDAAAVGECSRRDGRAEVIARARVVLDLGVSARDRGLDALLDVLRRGHSRPSLAAILWKAMITLSDKGAEKVHEYLASQQQDAAIAGLRVGVRGGGCSGFQYQLAFDEQRDSDAVFESHGLKLLVDRESLPYVSGSTIDYEESLQGAGFKVSNPNVVAACGCGSSFRVAEREQASAL